MGCCCSKEQQKIANFDESEQQQIAFTDRIVSGPTVVSSSATTSSALTTSTDTSLAQTRSINVSNGAAMEMPVFDIVEDTRISRALEEYTKKKTVPDAGFFDHIDFRKLSPADIERIRMFALKHKDSNALTSLNTPHSNPSAVTLPKYIHNTISRPGETNLPNC